MFGHFSYTSTLNEYIDGDSNHKAGIGLSQSINDGYGSSEFNRIKFKDDSYHKTADSTKAIYGKDFLFNFNQSSLSSNTYKDKQVRSEIPNAGTYMYSNKDYGVNLLLNKLWNVSNYGNGNDKNIKFNGNKFTFQKPTINPGNDWYVRGINNLTNPTNYDTYLNMAGDFGLNFSIYTKKITDPGRELIDKNNLLSIFSSQGNNNILKSDSNSLTFYKYDDASKDVSTWTDKNSVIPYKSYLFPFTDKKGVSKTWNIGCFGISFVYNRTEQNYALTIFSDNKGQEHINIDQETKENVKNEITNVYSQYTNPISNDLSLSYVNFLEGQKLPSTYNQNTIIKPVTIFNRKSLTTGSDIIKVPPSLGGGLAKNIVGQTRVPKKPKDRSKDANIKDSYNPSNFNGETLIQNWNTDLSNKFTQSVNNSIIGFRTRYINLYGFDRDITSSDSDAHSKYNPSVYRVSDQLNDSTIGFQYGAYFDNNTKLWLNTSADIQLAYNDLNSYDFTSKTNPVMKQNSEFKSNRITIIQNNPVLSTGGIVAITLTFIVTVPINIRVLYLLLNKTKKEKK